jgi:addiction module HigA family antidote
MGLLHDPHPGEILREEFLNEIGMSQNQLAEAIGVPGNRIHAIVRGTRDITADTDLRLCRFFRLSEGISCAYRTLTTRLKPSVASRTVWLGLSPLNSGKRVPKQRPEPRLL